MVKFMSNWQRIKQALFEDLIAASTCWNKYLLARTCSYYTAYHSKKTEYADNKTNSQLIKNLSRVVLLLTCLFWRLQAEVVDTRSCITVVRTTDFSFIKL